MRKVDPDGVKRDFILAVNSAEALTILIEDVPAAARQAIELQLLSGVVYWEGFINDLFVAYINRDSQRFAESLKTRVFQAVERRFGRAAAEHTTVALPAHLDRATAEALLDHSGRNLGVSCAKDLLTLATTLLAPADARRIANAVGESEQAAIDAWLAIRNFVAHRSHAAWQVMNEALSARTLAAELRRGERNVNSVGKYLMASMSGRSRAGHIFEGMRALARRM